MINEKSLKNKVTAALTPKFNEAKLPVPEVEILTYEDHTKETIFVARVSIGQEVVDLEVFNEQYSLEAGSLSDGDWVCYKLKNKAYSGEILCAVVDSESSLLAPVEEKSHTTIGGRDLMEIFNKQQGVSFVADKKDITRCFRPVVKNAKFIYTKDISFDEAIVLFAEKVMRVLSQQIVNKMVASKLMKKKDAGAVTLKGGELINTICLKPEHLPEIINIEKLAVQELYSVAYIP